MDERIIQNIVNLNALVTCGCRVTDVYRLRDTVSTVLKRENIQKEGAASTPDTHGRVFRPAGPLVTAADIKPCPTSGRGSHGSAAMALDVFASGSCRPVWGPDR